jgi:hypothetical protein
LIGAAADSHVRIIARSERYTIVTGKGYRPRVQKLGKGNLPRSPS